MVVGNHILSGALRVCTLVQLGLKLIVIINNKYTFTVPGAAIREQLNEATHQSYALERRGLATFDFGRCAEPRVI